MQKKSFPILFNIISQQTPEERGIFFTINSEQHIIDLLKDSAYKVPKFKKTIMVTEVIDELNVPFKDIIMSGVKDEIDIGSIRGNQNPFFFYFKTDIQKFLVNPDAIISSKSIDLAYKEVYQPGVGYCLFPVSPCIEDPTYEISINTLCITEDGFDELKKILKLEKKKKRRVRIPDNKFKQLCKDVDRECPRTFGERIFFNELSKVSKLNKYDPTGRGYKTWQSAKKRYYEVFPSKKANQ